MKNRRQLQTSEWCRKLFNLLGQPFDEEHQHTAHLNHVRVHERLIANVATISDGHNRISQFGRCAEALRHGTRKTHWHNQVRVNHHQTLGHTLHQGLGRKDGQTGCIVFDGAVNIQMQKRCQQTIVNFYSSARIRNLPSNLPERMNNNIVNFVHVRAVRSPARWRGAALTEGNRETRKKRRAAIEADRIWICLMDFICIQSGGKSHP